MCLVPLQCRLQGLHAAPGSPFMLRTLSDPPRPHWIVRWKLANAQMEERADCQFLLGGPWIVHFGWNEAVDPELLLLPATKVPVAALLLLLLSVKPAAAPGEATHAEHNLCGVHCTHSQNCVAACSTMQVSSLTQIRAHRKLQCKATHHAEHTLCGVLCTHSQNF